MRTVDYINAIRFRFNRYPSHLILFVTARCNARCRHCFYWREIDAAVRDNELSLYELRRISEGLGHVKFLSLTGGEPSLRADLPEIIALFSRNNRVQHVVLHTNGLLTDSIHDAVTRAAAANPNTEINVSVSIDALAERHDHIRGVPGIFAKAVSTVDSLAREKKRFRNLHVTVNSCFNLHNQDDAAGLADYLFEHHDIDGYYLSWVRGDTCDGKSRNVDVGKYLEAVSRLQRKQVIERYYTGYPLASLRRTLDFLAPRIVAETVINGKMPYPCMAGKSVVVISETGEVRPCEMLRESFGNLREHDYDLKKMLFSREAIDIKRKIADRACSCTWECAVMNNLVFNWRAYPRIIRTWLALEFEKRFGK